MNDLKETCSYEFVRQALGTIDKFEKIASALGKLYATQEIRPLARLHTYYPGERTELDYTKYGIWLFPNEKWNEPLFFFTGFGIDHASTCFKGFTVTTAPAARDAIRLYKRCVLPKSLWLPPSLASYAQNWDVCGLENTIAIDNDVSLVAGAAMIVFLSLGTIVLRMPLRRGDAKGTIERSQKSFEQQNVSCLDGYVPHKWAFTDPKYQELKRLAKSKASLTIKQYVNKITPGIVESNHKNHPRLRIPRIEVFRNGQEIAPLILPTGILQLRLIFALTFRTTLTVEGVEVETFKYNSKELGQKFLTYSGPVYVKLDPDDATRVLVLHHEWREPVEAFLTTFNFGGPVPLELLRICTRREDGGLTPRTVKPEDIPYLLQSGIADLQESPPVLRAGQTYSQFANAAAQAAELPPCSKPAAAEAPFGSAPMRPWVLLIHFLTSNSARRLPRTAEAMLLLARAQ